MAALIQFADRHGIERLILSQGYSADRHPTPQQLREENDRVMRAFRHFPDRAYGSVYLSPAFPDFSLQEFDRCVRDGPMVSIGELEADKRCNVPEMDAIAERAAAMKVPILQHTWLKIGGNDPGESTPYDLVELAQRHPEVQFICAHTGGDWERGIRIVRAAKNVSAEMAGFDPTSGAVEMAVRELGAERVVYGSDVGGRSFASQLAKVQGADIPGSAKELILGGNLRRMLSSILRAKGHRLLFVNRSPSGLNLSPACTRGNLRKTKGPPLHKGDSRGVVAIALITSPSPPPCPRRGNPNIASQLPLGRGNLFSRC
jgi:predicted TIM-barrel fold metal-dependent hydrolase